MGWKEIEWSIIFPIRGYNNKLQMNHKKRTFDFVDNMDWDHIFKLSSSQPASDLLHPPIQQKWQYRKREVNCNLLEETLWQGYFRLQSRLHSQCHGCLSIDGLKIKCRNFWGRSQRWYTHILPSESSQKKLEKVLSEKIIQLWSDYYF